VHHLMPDDDVMLLVEPSRHSHSLQPYLHVAFGDGDSA
jgi:hypothetical protein